MRQLETVILQGAKNALSNSKLRLMDIMEWSTSETKVRNGARPDEIVVYIDDPCVWIAVKIACDKRARG